jgi:hypothetical protein
MNEARNGAEPYHALGDVWQGFVIDEQASVEPPGSERLLDTPSRR